MKKTLLFVAVVLANAYGVLAQPLGKWVYVTESRNAKFAVAKTAEVISLDSSKQIMEIWVKVEFDKVKRNGVAYQIGLQRIDLANGRFAFREVIGYNKDGKELSHRIYRDEELKWQNAAIGTVGKELLSHAEYLFDALTSEQDEVLN